MKQVLRVDLTADNAEKGWIDGEFFKKYVGGSGLGAKIMWGYDRG